MNWITKQQKNFKEKPIGKLEAWFPFNYVFVPDSSLQNDPSNSADGANDQKLVDQAKEAQDLIENTDYVAITWGSKVLKAKKLTRRGAAGNDIFICPIKGIASHQAPDSVRKITLREFNWYKLWNDPSQRTALIGLGIAIIGAIIDGCYAAGRIHVYIPLPELFNVIILILAMLLKIIGLILVFKKGFLEAK